MTQKTRQKIRQKTYLRICLGRQDEGISNPLQKINSIRTETDYITFAKLAISLFIHEILNILFYALRLLP